MDDSIPEMEEKTQRDAKGRFVVGNTLGAGANNGQKGWARYADRLNYWLDRLTYEDVKRLVSTPEGQREMGEMTVRDAQIITHIARTLTGKDIGRERERMLNRLEGMPVKTMVVHDGDKVSEKDIDACSDEEAQEAYEAALKGS